MPQFQRIFGIFTMDETRAGMHYPRIMSKNETAGNLPERSILLLAVIENSADWRWKRPPSDHFNLWIPLEGTGEIVHSGKVFAFAPGTMFLFPPGLALTGCLTSGLRMVNFTAHLRRDARLGTKPLSALAWNGLPATCSRAAWLAPFCRYLAHSQPAGQRKGSRLASAGLEVLLESMERARREPPPDRASAALSRLVEKIRRNPAAHYSVEEMARETALSESQLTRRFRALVGESPNRFLLGQRLLLAESLLRESSLTVREISERLGYADPYFFSRQFRRFRGVPPSSLRKETRGSRAYAQGARAV
jgi:AraC-like DNA-binding protein